ncbi:MAG TPA: TOBE domain-containing protein, partial [Thermodesulfobacteriota bacterium]|nr:TOBE domain-containing protein [Thermodesulfobacteriota bacterium]
TIYVTHDQEEALTLSDRIAVVDHGKLQQVGAPRDLYAKPENPFVADFIGINNLLPGEVVEAADHGRKMRVKTEAGAFACVSEREFQAGERCMLTVRPETASISRAENSAQDMNVLPGTVNFASYIGNTIRYDIEIAQGKIFKVDVQNPWFHQVYPQGEKVFVLFPEQITLAIPVPEGLR